MFSLLSENRLVLAQLVEDPARGRFARTSVASSRRTLRALHLLELLVLVSCSSLVVVKVLCYLLHFDAVFLVFSRMTCSFIKRQLFDETKGGEIGQYGTCHQRPAERAVLRSGHSDWAAQSLATSVIKPSQLLTYMGYPYNHWRVTPIVRVACGLD